MKRNELQQQVQAALDSYTQGATPSVARYSARTDTKGKPAGAYVASVKAVRKHDKEQAQAAHDAYEATGYEWAQKDNAINETRKAEAFAFAGASSEELALVAAGVKRWYKERKAGIVDGPLFTGKDAHVGAKRQLHTLDQRQGEKIAILDGFSALYDMARTGDDWEREAAQASFEQLYALGWNELVASCRTLRSVHAGKGLTADEAKTLAAKGKSVRKQESKAKPVSTADLVNQARELAVALAQRGNIKGIDTTMLMRALGVTHQAAQAETARKVATPAAVVGNDKPKADAIREAIKSKLNAVEGGAMAKAMRKAA